MSSKSGSQSKQQKGQQRTERQNSAKPISRPQVQEAQAARKEARTQRQMEARAAAARRRRAANLRKIAVLTILFVVLAAGALASYLAEESKPGDAVAQLPSIHIRDANEPHLPYNTDPPTSGPHLGSIAPWGVSSTPITKELAVHNLEDAGVIVNYSPDLDKATVERLAEVVRGYDTEVLMAPYPGLSHPIVLTTWRRIDRLQAFDEVRIKQFIDAYRGIDHHGESGS